jgi:hypothetical protein
MFQALINHMPTRKKALPKPTYDSNRPGTSVLVDLVAVKLAAADITLGQWAEPYWSYGISPSVVVVFNLKLRNECAPYDKVLQSKRASADSKARATRDRRSNLGFHSSYLSDSVELEFNSKEVTLSRAEQQRLKKIVKDLIDRSEAWHKAQKEAANQELAVNAVSELLGVEALT